MFGFKRKLINVFGKCLWPFYEWHMVLRDGIASSAFTNTVEVGGMSSVRYPFYLHGDRYIKIGSGFVAGPGLRIEAWDRYANKHYQPRIIIGDRVVLNFNVHIGAINEIRIGDDVLIGSNVLITDHSHGGASLSDANLPPLQRDLASKGPVIIDDNVWIGEGVCILPGVHIGRNAVVGANAVVNRNVAAGDTVGGVPAKVLTTAFIEH